MNTKSFCKEHGNFCGFLKGLYHNKPYSIGHKPKLKEKGNIEMKNKHWIVICMKQSGKQWAYVLEWHGSWNLANCDILSDSRLLSANICDSKKDAWRIADAWNAEFRKAGIFSC